MIAEPAARQDTIRPTTYEEVAETVRAGAPLLPVGGGSKPALSQTQEGFQQLSMGSLSGIVEYQPSEFTITARAGTSLREMIAALAENGQYLPWDPPLVETGATLGGAIAAGLSGSGRYRYGGLRDFLVGIRFVDGQGRIVRGGGKVVKNAAGFDLPKLFVGSMGRLGVLVEATFKVFPQPPAWTTLRLPLSSIADAQRLIARLGQAPLDLNALDLEIDAEDNPALWLRVGGLATALPERMERLRGYLGGGEMQDDETESRWWSETASLAWASDDAELFYAALLPSRLAEVEGALRQPGISRRYACGGSILWAAAASDAAKTLEESLLRTGIPAVRIRGTGAPLLGHSGGALLRRVKTVLDPAGIFPQW